MEPFFTPLDSLEETIHNVVVQWNADLSAFAEDPLVGRSAQMLSGRMVRAVREALAQRRDEDIERMDATIAQLRLRNAALESQASPAAVEEYESSLRVIQALVEEMGGDVVITRRQLTPRVDRDLVIEHQDKGNISLQLIKKPFFDDDETFGTDAA